MNVERAIRKAVTTGKVVLGAGETIKAVSGNKANLVIVAENCPASFRKNLTQFAALTDLPIYEFGGTSLALGSVCGKPFLVSMLGIIDAGNSEVMKLAMKRS